MFKEQLKNSNIKVTKTRLEIIQLLADENKFMSAFGIKDKLEHFDISTIYRTLNIFDEKKLTSKKFCEKCNSFEYKYIDHKHSHRLTCMNCQKVVEIDFCPMDVFEKDDELTKQFTVTDYVFELFGYCEQCQKEGNANE